MVMFSNGHSLPWDQRTPFTYFIEVLIDIVLGEFYWIVTGLYAMLFISLCLHSSAFHKIYLTLVSALCSSDGKDNKDEILRELVHFHQSAKE